MFAYEILKCSQKFTYQSMIRRCQDRQLARGEARREESEGVKNKGVMGVREEG